MKYRSMSETELITLKLTKKDAIVLITSLHMLSAKTIDPIHKQGISYIAERLYALLEDQQPQS